MNEQGCLDLSQMRVPFGSLPAPISSDAVLQRRRTPPITRVFLDVRQLCQGKMRLTSNQELYNLPLDCIDSVASRCGTFNGGARKLECRCCRISSKGIDLGTELHASSISSSLRY